MEGAAVPVTIEEGQVCIYGGHLGEHTDLRYWQRVWIAKVLDREDARFVTIDKTNPACLKFLNNDVSMVERLKTLRNDKVAQQIQAKRDAADDDEHVHKKQRGDALDDIEQILTLSVEVGGERKEVRVLPTASNAHNLSVELKPEALTLLLSMPDGEDAAPFMPEIPCECPNVGWRGGVEATLVTRFWAEGKWRYSHKSVPRGDAEEDAWSERVRDAALILQNTFVRKHAPPASPKP